MAVTCFAPRRGIRGGDQKKVSAGNADGFIVRFFRVVCNEWTASRRIAPPPQYPHNHGKTQRLRAEPVSYVNLSSFTMPRSTSL